MANSIVGTWVFNDTITQYPGMPNKDEAFNVIYSQTKQPDIVYGQLIDGTGSYDLVCNWSGGGVQYGLRLNNYPNGNSSMSAYFYYGGSSHNGAVDAVLGGKTLILNENIYNENIILRDGLLEWLKANATKQGEEPEAPTATVITYNNETIATLEAGQTATIKTAETEVEHDIVITPAFPINIAYGDIIATAEAGQTATVKCANTEADFDIVVSAKADITDLTGTTWLFNSNINRDKSAVGYGIKGTATSGEYTFEVQSIQFGERSGSSNYFVIQYAPVGSSYGAFFRQWGNWEYYDGRNWYNISTPPTLTITGGADVTNADLIAWLKANATKQ